MLPFASPHPRTSRPALVFAATLLWSGASVAQEIWAITESGAPLQGTHSPTRVIELDAARRIEAELAAGLPNDLQQAESILRRRLKAGGPSLQRRLQTAYQGVADAWSLGITTLPAVVVDQRYVVYGEANLDQALARIARYRKEHP